MAEKKELYNLINGKTKLPKMRPVPDISQFEINDIEKSDLSKYRLSTIKRYEVYDILSAMGKRFQEINSTYEEKSDSTNQTQLPKSFYIKKLQEWACRIPVIGLLPEWEANIESLIPKIMKKKHSKIYESIMQEAKDIYVKQMRNLEIQRIVVFDTDEEIQTDFYDHCICPQIISHMPDSVFIKRRNFLEQQYFLSHNVIKSIIIKAHSQLPSKILNMKRYPQLGLLDLSSFQNLIMKDIKKGGLIVTKNYYRYTEKLIKKSKSIQKIPSKKLLQFMRCVTNVFVQQILNSMMNTINHVIEAMQDHQSCPQINLQLVCENNKLAIKPSIEEIYLTYHSIIDNVTNIAQDFIPLEEWLNIKTDQEYIKIKLPEWFIVKSHSKLQQVLEEIFQPLNNYFEEVTTTFGAVCSSETKSKIEQFVKEEQSFEVYCNEVKKFNIFAKQANAMVGNIYYATGKLEQLLAKESLKNCALSIVDIVLKELIVYHRSYNESICYTFEELKMRLLNVPNNAKALFELSDYASHASRTLVYELEKKIEKSINMLLSLIYITSLTEDHMELNRRTINWMQMIFPIFEQSNTLCEAMKCELEDELQRKINTLNAEVDDIFPKLIILDDMDDAKRIREYIEDLRVLVTKMDRIDEQIEWINMEEKLFKFPETLFPKNDEIKDIIMPFYSLIYLIHKWQRDSGVWLDGPFEYLNSTTIEEKTLYYLKEFTEITKTFKAKIKMDISANKPYRFSGIVDDPDPMQQPAPLKLCWQVLDDINKFKQYVSLAVCMCNPALVKRHWDEMSAIAGFDLTPNAGTTLRKIIEYDLMGNIEKYQIISISANKELALQHQLFKMVEEWNSVVFVTELDEKSNIRILTELNDIEILLEDHLIKIQEMRGSYFVKPIQTDVMDFFDFLLRIQNIINLWTQLQKHCLYFLPVFSNEVAAEQLAEEKILFTSVKITMQNAMDEVSNDARVQHIGKNLEFLENLKKAANNMEKISNGIHNYLNKKRTYFPRFFFLSDKEIMQILFESENPKEIQNHLKKCFTYINKLGLNYDMAIFSIIGDCNEEIELQNIIDTSKASGCVENWLAELEKEIRSTLRDRIVRSYIQFNETSLIEWILNNPNMVAVCVLKIYWTAMVEDYFLSGNPAALKEHIVNHSKFLSAMLAELKTQLPKKNKIMLMTMIYITSHQREILNSFLEKNITCQSDFNWKAQLRYYWHTDKVKVSMIRTEVNYGYEYSGNQPYIINTPLTDRCQRTIMEAYLFHLYGAVVGPSGTGKTETIRSLARSLALQFHVFNCTDSLDYKSIKKILIGMISCGAWICFEDFHRIRSEILSLMAQQMYSISQAIGANLETINLDGTILKLHSDSYICITMNSGWVEKMRLPDNMKVLFRNISMFAPDILSICEMRLFAAGFSSAKMLAAKITVLNKLCSEQLSSQAHYDLGARSIKLIVDTAVNLKFRYPNEDESVLILRALIDVNIPKLLEQDVLIFEGLLQDLFPNVILPPPNYQYLLNGLNDICLKNRLDFHEVFKLKAIQIFETMYIENAFVLVGEPFGGKTTVLRALAEALSLLNEQENLQITFKVQVETINPKSLTIDQLFGYTDPICGQWFDGVCSKTCREFSSDQSPSRKWLIFDGPVDSSWTEKLNTFLDDNKILFLTSRETIKMSQLMSVIFETKDLLNASPAMISRCGIIYFDPDAAGWRPLLNSWILKHNVFSGCDKLLYSLFDWSMDACLNFIKKKCTMTISTGDIHLVSSTLNLLEMYLKDALEDNPEELEKKEHFGVWCQAALIMSTVWGAASTLDLDSRAAFDTFYVSLWNGTNGQYPLPPTIKQLGISLPGDGLLRENFYIFKGNGSWKNWNDLLKSEKILEQQSIQRAIVPTIDTWKCTNLLLRHVKHRKPFILSSNSVTGKTVCIRDLLTNELSQEIYLPNIFNFTSTTTANQAQQMFLSKLNRIRKGHYGPPKNQFYVNFVDDLNAPKEEICRSRSSHELIRQYFDHEYWYDLKEPSKVFIHDMMFVSAMTLGDNRKNLCPRFLRHFNIHSLHPPSKENIFKMYTNVLLSNLKENGFSTDILSSINSMVNATIDMFLAIVKTLKPIPAKFHYTFNLRDVSRVINGCSLIQKESVETKVTFIRLWVHETLRVFADRMTDGADKEWLFEKIKQSIKTHYKDPFEAVFDHLPKFDKDHLNMDSLRDLAFGNFMNAEKSSENRRYEEISNMETLKSKVLVYLNEYNENHSLRMNLIFFRYALEHLIRICRILSIPCGSLLMICIGGTGRRSLTRLAAYIQRHQLFEPAIGPNYDLQSWREDLKEVLRDSGGYGRDVTFFMTDRQIREAFLQDISSLLHTGEVPSLFTSEERQKIIEIVRLPAQGGNRNLEISIHAVMEYFIKRCKDKLHFILCFNPTGSSFKTHLRSYSNLVSYCTLDWCEPWPEDGLEQIATKIIKDVNISEDLKVNSISAYKYFHKCAKKISEDYYNETGRKSHVTIQAFFHMVSLYTELMSNKQNEIMTTKNRYLGGLEKLELAARQVAQMKATLTTLRPQLELSAKQTAATMMEIESENISVEKATILVKRDEEIANRKAEIAGALKTECEADLAVAIPILEDAVAALNTLKPTDITLVKAMKNPPDTVKLVMAAVCVMLNVHPDRSIDPATGKKITDYWGPSKRVLGDMNFLQNLKDYDKDNIPATLMQVIKKTYMPDKSFMPHIVAKASSAAEGLCKWVRAMVSYDEIAKVVAPKKEKLAAAQRECDETEAFLNEKRKTLAALNEKLAALNLSLQATLAKKLELENEVANCSSKLMKAEALISSLGGEKNRWVQSAECLKKLYDSLVGDILISSGTIAYLSFFNMKCRYHNICKWKEFVKKLKIPCSEDFEFRNILGSQINISIWYVYGLPKNQFSVENAIIMDNAKFWSLLIDPENQANKWIREMEKCNNLEVVKLSNLNYMSIIRRAIETGVPVLLENIKEELDVSLDSILSKNIYKKNEVSYLDVGHDTIVYHKNFRLYMTTKLYNPQYLPYVFDKVTVIDFALPTEALEDRLLDIVIAKERPELQEKFEELLVQSASNQKALKQEEDNILTTLSATNTNILEDESAIRILDSSKNLAMDITRREAAIKATRDEINEFRKSYAQFTKYSAMLYSTLIHLPNLNPMYRFSLAWFTQLYVTSIDTSNRSILLKRRLEYLKTALTQNLHSSICSSLFEKHKLLYTFMLYSKTLLDSKEITEEEIKFFTSNGCEHYDSIPNPASTWLQEDSWIEICKLSSTITAFQDFAKTFSSNSWQSYFQLSNPEDQPLPEPWEDNLTPFQKLIVTKIIRPDKVVVKITMFIENGMGKSFIDPLRRDISQSYTESSCLLPIIFLLPSDADPMITITRYAEKVGYSSRLSIISMSEDQADTAKLAIEQARRDGWWIFLQNCHLVLSWMAELENICENFNTTNTSVAFRLWLSSYPDEQFPISILENSTKIANDSPIGLKENLLSCYHSELIKDKKFFDGCPGKDKTFSKLLYGLCFFHAVVRERKQFGFYGWNVPYEFEDSCFQISARQLQAFLKEQDEIPINALLYLFGECNYGGQIMDIMDKKCLITLLPDYCSLNTVTDPNYGFASGSAYLLPKRCEYRDYLQHINNIPRRTSPEVLGLDESTDVIRDNAIVQGFLESLSSMNEIVLHKNEKSTEDVIKTIINDIRDKLHETWDVDMIEEKYPCSYANPMNIVLVQQVHLYNELLTKIKNSLNRLELAYDGDILITSVLEKFAEELINGKVPSYWYTACKYPSVDNLANFISNLAERVTFIKSWLDEGQPRLFWLPGLSLCTAFLSVSRLMFARKRKIPVNEIIFDYEVLSEAEMHDINADNIIYITGLFIMAARWDGENRVLIKNTPKILSSPIPIICFKMIDNKQSLIIKNNIFECPLYVIAGQTRIQNSVEQPSNLISLISLPTNIPAKYWIKRKTSLFCQCIA